MFRWPKLVFFLFLFSPVVEGRLSVTSTGLFGQESDRSTLPTEGQNHVILRFDLASIEPSPAGLETLRSKILEGPPPHIVVQAWGCKTGGRDASLRVASLRGELILRFLEREFPGEKTVQLANPIASPTEEPERARRVEIDFLPTEIEAGIQFQSRNDLAQKINGSWTDRDAAEPNGVSRVNGWKFLYYTLAGLTGFFLIVSLTRRIVSNRRRNRHRSTPEERAVLQSISGGTPELPIPAGSGVRPLVESLAPIEAKKTNNGEGPMAFKKSQKKKQTKEKSTGFNLRSLLDREFETRSLRDLKKSPIHALEGLTPRHSRMMEEAFGIRSIEDLALLKYVDIARAITVLSDYEEE